MITVGTVVKSVAGRDQGRYYMVTKLEGQAVYIADGKLRRLSRPKRKNQKHLQLTNHAITPTPQLTDKQLRKALTILD